MSENKNPYDRRPKPGDSRRPGRSGGEFKVNIDYEDSFFPIEPVRPSGNETGRFSVNIPDDASRAPSARRAPSRPVQPTRSGARPSASSARPTSPKSASSGSRSGAKPKAPTPPKKAPAKSSSGKKRVRKDDLSHLSTSEIKLIKQTKKHKRMKSLLAFIVCFAVIAVITVALSTIAIGAINDILAIDKSSGTTISVVVEEGDNFDKVFNKLCDNGLISQKQISRFFCLYRKYDTVEYEPGAYYFETNDGVEVMLEEMMVKTGNANSVVRLTFPEGWSIRKIFEKIEKYEVCTTEKLYANIDIIAKQYSFYEKVKTTNNRTFVAEGYLFPDTYEFYKGESASSVLKKLFSNFEKKWNEKFATRAKELGMSCDDVLKIASIIQREAGSKSQMYAISSVIHNRLMLPSSFPNIQCDSTTDYILSYKDSGIFSDYDYKIYYNSYNTYSAQGLPPGPICNPGMDAIDAALNPDSSSYYYFAHDVNGQIYLASTASEHEINRAQIASEEG